MEDLLRQMIDKVKDLCIEASIKSETRLNLEADRLKIKDVARKLSEIGFDHVKSVTGVDYPDKNLMEVVYHISSYKPELAKVIVKVKTTVPRDNPIVSSLVDIWPSAEYLERETYDLLGIVFEGHPKLKRLLLPEELEGKHPLRKDFVIKEEGIEA